MNKPILFYINIMIITKSIHKLKLHFVFGNYNDIPAVKSISELF